MKRRIEAAPGTFAARLLKVMNDKGLSLRQVGEAIGVTGQAVHAWTAGLPPKLDRIEPLAEFLDVSAGWLAFGDKADTSDELARLRGIVANMRELLGDNQVHVTRPSAWSGLVVQAHKTGGV